VAVAPRPPHPQPDELALSIPDQMVAVSSSEVRRGRREWMVAEAQAFDHRTGAWSEPERYERWIARTDPLAP